MSSVSNNYYFNVIYSRIGNQAWITSEYKKARSKELEKKLELVEPHKPKLDDVIIVGIPGLSHYQVPHSDIQLNSIEFIQTDNKEKIKPTHNNSFVLNVAGLKITPMLRGVRKIHVLFNYNIEIQKIATENIIIHNQGTVAIRFCWRAAEKFEIFRDIIKKNKTEALFFFNKNEGIILPNQQILFPFWFKVDVPGTFSEYWEFVTLPNILPDESKVVVVLQATAVFGNLRQKSLQITEDLDAKMRNRLVAECLSHVLSQVPVEKTHPVIRIYNKRHLCEALNSSFDPLNKMPKYLYNRNVIKELEEFYKKWRRPSDPRQWNFRIEDLRRLAYETEEKLEMKRRRTYLADLIKTYIEDTKREKKVEQLVPPVTQASAKGTGKSPTDKGNISPKQGAKLESTVKVSESRQKFISEIVNTGKEEKLYDELEKIILKLQRPQIIVNPNRMKFAQAYLILCTYFNKICHELYDLKLKMGIISDSKYPSLTNVVENKGYMRPELFIDDIMSGQPKLPSSVLMEGKPVPENLIDIPADDYIQRYKTYYGIEDDKPESKKGKGKDVKSKDNKKGKSEKTDAQPTKAKLPPAKILEPPPEYLDPPAVKLKVSISETPKIYETQPDVEVDSLEPKAEKQNTALLEQYKNNVYVTIYMYLEKAISCIVDMLEMQTQQPTRSTIKQVENYFDKRQFLLSMNTNVSNIDSNVQINPSVVNVFKKETSFPSFVKEDDNVQHISSTSSLWSILQSYKPCTKKSKENSQPVSYPYEHEEEIHKLNKTKRIEDLKFLTASTVHMSTSTSNAALDPMWEDFKDIAVQQNYDKEQLIDDLVSRIEKLESKTSAQDFKIKSDKNLQKYAEEYVSDEEFFFSSDSEDDSDMNYCECGEHAECKQIHTETKYTE